jgi:hypothetical protein
MAKSENQLIQELVDNGKRKEAERLLLASQTSASRFQLNSGKGLSAVRNKH